MARLTATKDKMAGKEETGFRSSTTRKENSLDGTAHSGTGSPKMAAVGFQLRVDVTTSMSHMLAPGLIALWLAEH